jgi:hypothetical protein
MIELPPPPATVQEAMRQANDLAYGFPKHTDPAYWTQGVGFQGDPVYYWKRMLGWQAGGADVARYGLYAQPPSPWRVPVVSLPTLPDPPSAPPDETAAGVLALVLARLEAIEQRLGNIDIPVPATKFPVYEGTIRVPYLGTGSVTLTPKP